LDKIITDIIKNLAFMKKISRSLLLFLLQFLLIYTVLASKNEDSSHTTKTAPAKVEQRRFLQLDKQLSQGKYFAPANSTSEFTAQFLQQHFSLDTATVSSRAMAQQTLAAVEGSNHYIDFISPGDLVDLPVGLKKKMGNSSITIGISNAKFMSGYTELTIFCKVILPQTDAATGKQKEIFFGADNVKLSNNGGLIGDANLVLLGDVPIVFNSGNLLLTLKGGLNMHTGVAQNLTYAKLECGGIKEIGLAADVSFPKSILVAMDKDYNADYNRTVKGSFSTIITDWNDILAEFSILEPFAIKGLENFAITIDKAVFDFSDIKNSPDVIFPPGYENLVPGNEQLWRGVFVNKLQIILPKEFKKRGKAERVSFEANQMLIDNMGLTGNFAANNILQSGSASGWEFSVDHFFINVKANHLTAAGFDGYIALPLTKSQQGDSLKNTAFGYKAIISPGSQYLMRVSTLSNLKFDVWQATAHIDAASYLELLVRNGQFRPKAVLNGGVDINVEKETSDETSTGNGKSITTIKGIVFQQLVLQTEAPYIQVGFFGYKGEAKLSNFPISIYDIGVTINSQQIKLGLGVKVNLMAGKISAKTHFYIVGEMVEENEKTSYAFKKIEINDVIIDSANFGSFKMNGVVHFNRNHPIMGSGFAGDLNLTIKLGNEIKVSAKAAFGCKPLSAGETESFRYWYIDALASGFTIPCGTFSITGIGGGASYHMLRSAAMVLDSVVVPTLIGYIPSAELGLGFRAMVTFNVGTSEISKGEAGLEMMFTSSGGLANIGFYGKAFVMPSEVMKELYDDVKKNKETMQGNLSSLVQKITNADAAAKFIQKGNLAKFTDMAQNDYPSNGKSVGSEGKISAYVGINYDFQNHVLHANLDLYVNILGVIVGRGNGNRAGWAVMHFSPEEWYIYLGTPTDKMGLKMGVGSISVQTGSYFMAGTHIPSNPPPPPVVAEILNVQTRELDYMRDMNALSDGRGFAFGSDFSLNTGDLRFLMFYASFQAGMGFDIMLKNYGDAHCVGSSMPIGMNGWYANGQSYAYLQGELGIQIKLLFITKKIPIIKAGAAVILQAKLPNPSWFKGYMGGYFSILGGLIKGKFHFKVTIGEVCEMSNAGPLDDVKVISDITPADKATQVDVFASPQTVFNMPVEKPFTIDDDQGTKTYRIKLAAYTVTSKGNPVVGSLKWNERNDAVTFESAEILPPNADMKATVKVLFEEQKNGSWQTVYDHGKQAAEEKEINFTTGIAPDYIPLTNIAYSYPVVDQQFLFPKEYGKGYVQLKRGQAYLLNQPVYQQLAQFTVGDEIAATASFNYDSASKKITLLLPGLQIGKAYNYTLVGLTAKKDTKEIVDKSQNITVDDNDIQVANNKAAGIVISNKPHVFLTYNFGTSMYNSFKEKMFSKTVKHSLYEIILSDVGALQADVNSSEIFDQAELSGSDYTGNVPLVQPIATLNDDWFKQDINPLVYADYPSLPNFTISRDTTLLGLPPARAIDIMSWYQQLSLSSPDNSILKTRMPYRYYLGYYYKADFSDLQYKVVNQYIQQPSSVPVSVQRFITRTFPIMRTGKYKVMYRYILPGNMQTSEQEFEFENTVQ